MSATLADGATWFVGLDLSAVNVWQFTGSAYFFGSGRDVDVLVQTASPHAYLTYLKGAGWVGADGYTGGSSSWGSVKKGLINLIVCNPQTYGRRAKAAEACLLLARAGLLPPDDKPMRIGLHALYRCNE